MREALYRRWPAGEHVLVEEAPQDAARMGRKIDLLVVSAWASRGHALDAIEIKVSYSDWKKERDNPAKADWWWRHSHRFWIAAPADLAKRIRDELPETWGLLAIGDDGVAKQLVQAPRHEPEPLPWVSLVGILRAASGAGANAIARAREEGRNQGFGEGRNRAAGKVVADQLAELREQVRRAEDATGIPIARWPETQTWGRFLSTEDLHAAVKAVVIDEGAVATAERALREARSRIEQAAKHLEAVAP